MIKRAVVTIASVASLASFIGCQTVPDQEAFTCINFAGLKPGPQKPADLVFPVTGGKIEVAALEPVVFDRGGTKYLYSASSVSSAVSAVFLKNDTTLYFSNKGYVEYLLYENERRYNVHLVSINSKGSGYFVDQFQAPAMRKLAKFPFDESLNKKEFLSVGAHLNLASICVNRTGNLYHATKKLDYNTLAKLVRR